MEGWDGYQSILNLSQLSRIESICTHTYTRLHNFDQTSRQGKSKKSKSKKKTHPRVFIPIFIPVPVPTPTASLMCIDYLTTTNDFDM
jgi:hypothetical protein